MNRSDHPYAPEHFAEATVYERHDTNRLRGNLPVPVMEYLGGEAGDTIVFEPNPHGEGLVVTLNPADGEGADDDGVNWTDLTGGHDNGD